MIKKLNRNFQFVFIIPICKYSAIIDEKFVQKENCKEISSYVRWWRHAANLWRVEDNLHMLKYILVLTCFENHSFFGTQAIYIKLKFLADHVTSSWPRDLFASQTVVSGLRRGSRSPVRSSSMTSSSAFSGFSSNLYNKKMKRLWRNDHSLLPLEESTLDEEQDYNDVDNKRD